LTYFSGERLPPVAAQSSIRLPLAEVQVFERVAKTLGRLHTLLSVLLQDLPGTSDGRSGADAINISGLLNPKKLGNFINQML